MEVLPENICLDGADLMSFAICRMQKMKAYDLKGIQFHNQRERESRTNFDIDKGRSKENYDLVNDENIDYNKRVKKIIESQKTGTRKTRKDAVLVNEFIVTSDRDFFDDLNEQDQKRFFVESHKLFAERYGKQNIAFSVVHMDEKTPHMHLGVVPMRDGRLQGKNVFNRKELLWLQDNFPKHMQELGFDLERGEKGSDREHIETQRFKRETLKEDICLLEGKLGQKREELSAFNTKVPDEVKTSARTQYRRVEVKSKEVNFLGFAKKEMKKEPTGNVVIPQSEFENLTNTVRENKRLKGQLENLLATDVYGENRKLKKANNRINHLLESERKENEGLRSENLVLKKRNDVLKVITGNLRDEIDFIYKTTKDFLKERTDSLKSFREAFGSLRDRITDKFTSGGFRERQIIEEFEEEKQFDFSVGGIKKMDDQLKKAEKNNFRKNRGMER